MVVEEQTSCDRTGRQAVGARPPIPPLLETLAHDVTVVGDRKSMPPWPKVVAHRAERLQE
jgi:hypothetical protein